MHNNLTIKLTQTTKSVADSNFPSKEIFKKLSTYREVRNRIAMVKIL